MHCFLSDSLRDLAGDCRALKVGGRAQALVGPGQATPLSKLQYIIKLATYWLTIYRMAQMFNGGKF